MNTVTLHYIHDPLCGWCYGAAPLVSAARTLLPVVAHGGGMMAGAQRQRVSPQLRSFVMPHDRRIAQLTGQPFGQAYVDGLLRDETATLDSEPPITAMLAAEQLAGRGLDLLARLQVAHYQQGRRIADVAVLQQLAQEIGLDPQGFVQAYARCQGDITRQHIAHSRALLDRLGGGGFPTLALECGGQFTRIDIGPWLGRVQAWQAGLRGLVDAAAAAAGAPAAAAPPGGPACLPDACSQ